MFGDFVVFFPVVDSEAYSLIDEPKLTGTPERRLLLALLERAILDFVGNDAAEVEAAREWIFGEEEGDSQISDAHRASPFSFTWVCQELDLDPQNISGIIAAMPRRGSRRVAPWYFQKTGDSHKPGPSNPPDAQPKANGAPALRPLRPSAKTKGKLLSKSSSKALRLLSKRRKRAVCSTKDGCMDELNLRAGLLRQECA